MVAGVVSACAGPPTKEIDRAREAIDAARASEADRYANNTFIAATTALQQANDSVAQSDYRKALNHSLESRQRALDAVREATDNRARIRGELEQTMEEIMPLLTRANGRLTEAVAARVPRQTLKAATAELTTVGAAMRKADAARTAGDYVEAQLTLASTKDQVQKTLTQLDTALRETRQ
jgi:hypothetical protein